SVTLENYSTMEINAPLLVGSGTTFDNKGSGSVTISGTGDFQATTGSTLNAGTFILEDNATLQVNGTLFNNSGGTIQGTGIIISLSNANLGGTIIPGTSPGTLEVTNDVTFSGTIDLEIEGRGDNFGGTPGTDFDQIASTNSAALTLNNTTINLIFGAGTFYNGDQYTFFDFGSVATVGTINVNNNKGYVMSYLGNGVFLIVSGALPVEMTHFEAKTIDKSVLLTWGTASELDNDGFEIQRMDGYGNWIKIGFQKGNGTTLTANEYNYLDENPAQGTNYYRLKQFDFDGQFEYSPIVSATIEGEKTAFKVYPNPAKNTVNIALDNPAIGTIAITIFNQNGQQAGQFLFEKENEIFERSLDISSLPSGAYSLEIKMDRTVLRQRLVIP
ncbi:MAG: T9SS type A sorting domain-containing protein, partial [Saprospiraceae bacterium]|nr:T9SS type A sorting domain-containing protein [Saprospiraceae bacterium]